MKKSLTFIALLFIFPLFVNAQWSGTSPVYTSSDAGIGTTTPTNYFHGGTYKILEIQNPGTTLNSQAHLFLSTASVISGSSAGTITWVSKNSTGWKGMAYIGSILEGSGATNASASLRFATGNSGSIYERMIIMPGGNVGIGTGAPGEKLAVEGNISAAAAADATNTFFKFKRNSDGYTGARIGNNYPGLGYSGNLFFDVNNGGGTETMTTAMFIKYDGNVGIGTIDPGNYRLAVNGKIRAKEIIVETGWSDYVFYKNYRLPSLKEVSSYIKSNGHLPDVPSAKEVAANGIAVGETNSLFLKKIEELTLYLIEKDKQLAQQASRMDRLEKKLKMLSKNNKGKSTK